MAQNLAITSTASLLLSPFSLSLSLLFYLGIESTKKKSKIIFEKKNSIYIRSLEHLILGTKFSSHVDHLPPSLTLLSFVGHIDYSSTADGFYEGSVNLLPSSLTHLFLSQTFDKGL